MRVDDVRKCDGAEVSVGRCGPCGLGKGAWTGQGARLCETCDQRESRRAAESGAEMMAEGQRTVRGP